MITLHILITGGTLDKDYDEISGALTFPQTHLPQILSQARTTRPIELTELMHKDSLEMTNADREHILNTCIHSPHRHILITHGTDTMVETAQYIMNNQLKLKEKTIVLTGAMRPFALGQSDALFNLGTAFGFLNPTKNAKIPSPEGIFIAMNGQIFSGDEVKKNRKKGIFESL